MVSAGEWSAYISLIGAKRGRHMQHRLRVFLYSGSAVIHRCILSRYVQKSYSFLVYGQLSARKCIANCSFYGGRSVAFCLTNEMPSLIICLCAIIGIPPTLFTPDLCQQSPFSLRQNRPYIPAAVFVRSIRPYFLTCEGSIFL